MRNFRVTRGLPVSRRSPSEPHSVGSKKRGEAFSTDDPAFLLAFDCGQVEDVEEVAPEQEAPHPRRKRGKAAAAGRSSVLRR